jgi:hypothetical protein
MAQIREGIRGKVMGQKYNTMRTVLVRGENKELKNLVIFFATCIVI